jgi:hypothetical protein
VPPSFRMFFRVGGRAFRAANVQPRQRLALLLVAITPESDVVESKTCYALPPCAGGVPGFKSRQPDQPLHVRTSLGKFRHVEHGAV